VVLDDIGPLLNLDLGKHLIAGVSDFGHAQEWRERLEIENADTYLNNGVMLINAAEWRRQGITKKIWSWHKRLGGRAMYHDQDLLNAATIGHKALLDAKWNVMQHVFISEGTVDSFEAENFRGILHFTWLPKPWTAGAPAKLRVLYEREAALAPLRL
jgi:lipopolysaccharide biosynthesis glycosyltransferase